MVWICAKAATGEESRSHGFYFKKKGQREARMTLEEIIKGISC